MVNRQQQQFQFCFGTLFGPSSNTSDGTNRLIDGRDCQYSQSVRGSLRSKAR